MGLAFSFGDGLPPRRAGVAAASSFISATVTATSRCAPLRQTVSVTFVPGLTIVTMRGNSDELRTSRPSTLTMMSPASSPAFSAGPPFSTELTSAPIAFGRPNDSAVSLVTSVIWTPMRPRVTRPFSFNCATVFIARSIGIANDKPI